jgi:thymidine kinase
MKSNPEFIMFCGPMFSAKTSSLLLMLEKYKHQKKRICVFKPIIDNRYSTDSVVSHGGGSIKSHTIVTSSDVLKILSGLDEEPHVVAIDEAFMIPGIADILIYLYKIGMTVVVSTLEMSSAGKPFPEPEKMFPWATQVHKLTAACTICGADAHYTHKKSDTGVEIEVGSHELYEPRCYNHNPTINLDPGHGE